MMTAAGVARARSVRRASRQHYGDQSSHSQVRPLRVVCAVSRRAGSPDRTRSLEGTTSSNRLAALSSAPTKPGMRAPDETSRSWARSAWRATSPS